MKKGSQLSTWIDQYAWIIMLIYFWIVRHIANPWQSIMLYFAIGVALIYYAWQKAWGFFTAVLGLLILLIWLR